jgi:excisionase family DNA binding protein
MTIYDQNPNSIVALCEKQAANLLGLSPKTLRNWRSTGQTKLPFIKLGRAVRYAKSDLEAFCQANTHNSTSSYGGSQ